MVANRQKSGRFNNRPSAFLSVMLYVMLTRGCSDIEIYVDGDCWQTADLFLINHWCARPAETIERYRPFRWRRWPGIKKCAALCPYPADMKAVSPLTHPGCISNWIIRDIPGSPPKVTYRRGASDHRAKYSHRWPERNWKWPSTLWQ